MSKLLELAERCEAATEKEQQEVLRAAFKLIFPTEYGKGCARYGRFIMLLDARAYIDAAMTLVPDDVFCTDLRYDRIEGRCRVSLTSESALADAIGRAATPALGTSAAALRAQASIDTALNGEGDGG